MKKTGRSAELEEGRDTVIAGRECHSDDGSWVSHFRNGGWISFNVKWESVPKGTEEDQRSFGQVKAPLQKRRAVIRVESAEHKTAEWPAGSDRLGPLQNSE